MADNRLWQLDDNGATFWVIAPTKERAIELVEALPDRDDFDEPPYLEIDHPLTVAEAQGQQFYDERHDVRMSMWAAFLGHCSEEQVLACSEWP